MKLTRYQTDKRLWLCLAALFFLVPFCFCRVGKDPGIIPIAWCWYLVVAIIKGETGYGLSGEIAGLVITVFFFAIPAIVIAWFLQCATVVVKSKLREKEILSHSEWSLLKQSAFFSALNSVFAVMITGLSWIWLGEGSSGHGSLFGVFWFFLNIPGVVLYAAVGNGESQRGFFICIFTQWFVFGTALLAYARTKFRPTKPTHES